MRKGVALRLTLSLALFAGVLFAAVPSQANPGCKKNKKAVCPQIFAPVLCDKDRVYVNQCVADADCATGCQAF